MKKLLFQSNINHLNKVRDRLNYQQRMNSTQVILCEENQRKVIVAVELINQAAKILEGVK